MIGTEIGTVLKRRRLPRLYNLGGSIDDILNHFAKHLMHKDKYTATHSGGVYALSVAFGNYLLKNSLTSFKSDDLPLLKMSSFLHDVGKLRLDGKLLIPEGKLNNAQYKLMKTHIEEGVDILENSLKSSPESFAVMEAIIYHHENFDGTGYLSGISGENIPLLSRIIRITDSMDALTTRNYNGLHDLKSSLNIIQEKAGLNKYDHQLIKYFVNFLKKNDYNVQNILVQSAISLPKDLGPMILTNYDHTRIN